jgi:hypothetical protein
MTPEQRFQRIEESLIAVADSQTRTNQAMTTMADSISRYVEAADARMRRIEENLDGLIRVITAEHSNGKSQR